MIGGSIGRKTRPRRTSSNCCRSHASLRPRRLWSSDQVAGYFTLHDDFDDDGVDDVNVYHDRDKYRSHNYDLHSHLGIHEDRYQHDFGVDHD